MKTSKLAEGLKGSEIIKIAGEVNALKAKGEVVYNQTIGDFDSNTFPIPTALKDAIIKAYDNNLTNYPQANGMEVLRKNVSKYLAKHLGLEYSENEILISGGARPLIYAAYQTILDIDDTVLLTEGGGTPQVLLNSPYWTPGSGSGLTYHSSPAVGRVAGSAAIKASSSTWE